MSYIVDNFKQIGYLYYTYMIKITICIDKHIYQNKNSIVIWFIIWIIENVVLTKVILFFYVKGNTMNASYRLFNIMKGR